MYIHTTYTGCGSYNLETIPAYRKAIIGLEQGAENMVSYVYNKFISLCVDIYV